MTYWGEKRALFSSSVSRLPHTGLCPLLTGPAHSQPRRRPFLEPGLSRQAPAHSIQGPLHWTPSGILISSVPSPPCVSQLPCRTPVVLRPLVPFPLLRTVHTRPHPRRLPGPSETRHEPSPSPSFPQLSVHVTQNSLHPRPHPGSSLSPSLPTPGQKLLRGWDCSWASLVTYKMEAAGPARAGEVVICPDFKARQA